MKENAPTFLQDEKYLAGPQKQDIDGASITTS
jgi:hypothetical protein